MKKLLIGLLFSISTACAAEYAEVVDVKSYYTKPTCEGCMLPVLKGYTVFFKYKGEKKSQRMPVRPYVGDRWEVRNGRLYGMPIRQHNPSEYHGRFPPNSSDTERTPPHPSRESDYIDRLPLATGLSKST